MDERRAIFTCQVDEYNTSKLCAYCNRILTKITNVHDYLVCSLRRCIGWSLSEVPFPISFERRFRLISFGLCMWSVCLFLKERTIHILQYCCTEHCEQRGFVNRDGNGSVNILSLGLLALAGKVCMCCLSSWVSPFKKQSLTLLTLSIFPSFLTEARIGLASSPRGSRWPTLAGSPTRT
jgi:hypothetical protein